MNVIEVAEKFCAAWSSLDADALSSLFAPDGYYTDIAFGVTRRGRENVREQSEMLTPSTDVDDVIQKQRNS